MKSQFNPFELSEPINNVTEADRLAITRLCKRALMNEHGFALLDYLKSKTIDRKTEPFPFPQTQDQTVQYWMHRRFREGQNNIVQQILTEVHKELNIEEEEDDA